MSRTHAQIADAWARHKVHGIMRGFAVSAMPGAIYSYGTHFPLGYHVTTPSGAKVAVLNDRKWGKATAKHKLHTWRACHRAGLEMVYAPLPGERPGNRLTTDDMGHLAYDRAVAYAISSLEAVKWSRCYTNRHVADVLRMIEQARRVAELWNLTVKPVTVEGLMDGLEITGRHRDKVMAELAKMQQHDTQKGM